MSEEIKAKTILKWFVDESTVNRVLNSNSRVCESEVKCKPEQLFMAATEVDLTPAIKYLDDDAWTLVQEVTAMAKSREITCIVCNEQLDTPCVGCDMCLGSVSLSLCRNIKCAK